VIQTLIKILLLSMHSKQCWVVLTQIWVKKWTNPNVGLKM